MIQHIVRYWSNSIRANRSFLNTVPHRSLLTASVEDTKYVVVRDDNAPNEPLKFPVVWLRDNCQCPSCFNHIAQSRRHNWDVFNTNIQVTTLKVNAEKIAIQWSDHHDSIFDLSWLRERSFEPSHQQKYLETLYRPAPICWSGAEFERVVEKYEFVDVLNNDEALQRWLESLAVRGVALIQNAPLDETVVRQLANRVGFIRKTTYGEEFIVQSKPDAQNVAYLSEPLPLHTDLPYYEYKPSVNILHCMVQTNSHGGSNLLVDGFHIADCMRRHHQSDYKILTDTLVDWNDIGNDGGDNFHMIWRAPVICLDKDGNCTRINHSVPQRDTHFSVALEEVQGWYDAYAKFVHSARLDAAAFKTRPGDVLTFNNIRLLHGRTGYDDTDSNVRYIVGAYMDWDIIYSKLRVLKTARAHKETVLAATPKTTTSTL